MGHHDGVGIVEMLARGAIKLVKFALVR